jgi:chemotaxis signal transduction protein
MTRAILLPVGRNWYALPPVALQEVVADPDVTELPAAPATVRGLFNVRGQILPLLDTGALLGLERPARCPFAVVVRTAHGPAGLAVTGMPEPAELAWLVGPTRARGTMGAYAAGERIAVMLDPQALTAQVQAPGGR